MYNIVEVIGSGLTQMVKKHNIDNNDFETVRCFVRYHNIGTSSS